MNADADKAGPSVVAFKSLTPPVLVWLLIQLVAILIPTLGVSLSANFVQPPQAAALKEMIFAQMASAALLFPFLMRDGRAAIAVVLSCFPFLQFAGVMASTPLSRIAIASAFVSVWLITLALWRAALRPRWQMWGVAIASLLTLGGLVIWYLEVEFEGSHVTAFHGLIAAAWSQLDQPNFTSWIPLLVVFIAGCGAAKKIPFPDASRAKTM